MVSLSIQVFYQDRKWPSSLTPSPCKHLLLGQQRELTPQILSLFQSVFLSVTEQTCFSSLPCSTERPSPTSQFDLHTSPILQHGVRSISGPCTGLALICHWPSLFASYTWGQWERASFTLKEALPHLYNFCMSSWPLQNSRTPFKT